MKVSSPKEVTCLKLEWIFKLKDNWLQALWWHLWQVENIWFTRHIKAYWMSEAMSIQEVQLSRGEGAFAVRIWGQCCFFLVGCLQQYKGFNRKADLPTVLIDRRVWRDPWSFSWLFFPYSLGQLSLHFSCIQGSKSHAKLQGGFGKLLPMQWSWKMLMV